MAKAILFCADGTWNGSKDPTSRTFVDDLVELATGGEEGRETNVLKLFGAFAGGITGATRDLDANERERVFEEGGDVLQWAKYMHGVGDSRNLAIKAAGGVLGAGVIARIIRGFTFISRVYEPGDAIHIVGFSRGAYTARALAGMIANVGLLDRSRYDPSDRTRAYELGLAAWARSKSTTLELGKLTRVATKLLDWFHGKVADRIDDDMLIANVPIKSVAVWDTVGSMGIPRYEEEGRLDLFRFTDTTLSRKVERGFHAMAIDEMRRDFPVTRWDDAGHGGIEQVWFVGAHSDVGGGAGPKGTLLSDIALGWMIRKLETVGVRFAAPPHPLRPDVLNGVCGRPWERPPFDLFERAPRSVLPADTLHRSVVERWGGDRVPSYRPEAMSKFASLDDFTIDATV
jgi:uncharacterized protein (DUF2235 family)